MDAARETGDLSGCLVFVNNTFGSGLLEDGNSLLEALLGLLCRIGSDGGSNLLNRLLNPCLVTLVSDSLDLVLSRPFER